MSSSSPSPFILRQTLASSFVSAQDTEPDPDVATHEAAEELARFYRRLADVRDAVPEEDFAPAVASCT